MDALAHDLAQGMTVFRCGRRAVGLKACDVSRESSRRREKEVPGTAGGIDDGEPQQSLGGE